MTLPLPFIAAALAVQAPAAPPPITMEPADLPIEQQTALRCSVAMALATEMQRSGRAVGKDWPDLGERGQEFFVRTIAQLMDETGISREAIAVRGRKEAEELVQPGRLDTVMPPCLLLLEASGL